MADEWAVAVIVMVFIAACIIAAPALLVADHYWARHQRVFRSEHLLGCERLIERVAEDDRHREAHLRAGCASIDWCDVHDGPRPVATSMPGPPERRRG